MITKSDLEKCFFSGNDTCLKAIIPVQLLKEKSSINSIKQIDNITVNNHIITESPIFLGKEFHISFSGIIHCEKNKFDISYSFIHKHLPDSPNNCYPFNDTPGILEINKIYF